ncbi:MAG: polysaccharide deacetylase family protein [Peptostreptococcaceae bacterium]|nr:polysaccharide deacetylase family protein [Peptostreptococcaceae bacterium]
MKHTIKNVFLVGLILTIGLSGCANRGNPEADIEAVLEKPEETGFEELIEPEEMQPVVEALSNAELKAMGVNEMGRIMIVMYHSLSDEEKDYVRSRDNFREDLEILYEKGYRLITVADYIDGNIDIEAGMTPVVLTFDDGTLSNFGIIEENGEKVVDPECAVGILNSFAEEHPDFGRTAAFCLFGTNSFGQSEYLDYKLNYLIENGFEIESHSYGHENLSELDPEGIMKSLGKMDRIIDEKVQGYTIRALALPYGGRPKDDEGRAAIAKGQFEGNSYENEAVFAVGWQPERSPIDIKTDFQYLNRVHASNEEFGIRYWIENFDNHPERRYVSDGDADTFTISSADAESVSYEKIGDREVRVLE